MTTEPCDSTILNPRKFADDSQIVEQPYALKDENKLKQYDQSIDSTKRAPQSSVSNCRAPSFRRENATRGNLKGNGRGRYRLIRQSAGIRTAVVLEASDKNGSHMDISERLDETSRLVVAAAGGSSERRRNRRKKECRSSDRDSGSGPRGRGCAENVFRPLDDDGAAAKEQTATLNPFHLLGDDDAEDLSLLIATQQKNEPKAPLAKPAAAKQPPLQNKAAVVQPKLPSKPLPHRRLSERQNLNLHEVAVDMGVVMVGPLETQPTMKIHMATEKYKLSKVLLMRVMLESLLNHFSLSCFCHVISTSTEVSTMEPPCCAETYV
ncbi:hypothetical protein Salat_2775200 [Sesamum alatum]|uniref:STM1-like N-terminal domain-containing protein n=1 Tax=Sesamum alatum TaxID=300844 RepID=A0AAE1XLJ7_9LAMI|nr:hypothetical protein Salat_2775200 [Sesamum alatum]